MQILEKINIKLEDNLKELKFSVVILNETKVNNSFSGEILGRSLADWVAFACQGLPVRVVDYNSKDNILSIAGELIDASSDYTIFLLSITPLLESRIIQNIIDYCKYKDVNICKLPVGYVVKNKYLTSTDTLTTDSYYSQDIEDFYIVESKKEYNYALEILQDRINTFHMGNGVDIKKPKSVYIEPEVDLDSGVIIYPNNSLKGITKISHNVILKENNVIENSKVGSNSCISGSVINGSIIASNVYISAFCEINNSLIDENCIINSGCKINNYRLGANTKISPNTILGEENDSNNRIG